MICTICEYDKDSTSFYSGRRACKLCHNALKYTRHPDRYSPSNVAKSTRYLNRFPRSYLHRPSAAVLLSDDEISTIAVDSAGLLLMQQIIDSTAILPEYEAFKERAENVMF